MGMVLGMDGILYNNLADIKKCGNSRNVCYAAFYIFMNLFVLLLLLVLHKTLLDFFQIALIGINTHPLSE